jgi:hypothetical protein
MAITRVCIYTRISTDEENQPTSLHSQKDRLEAFCSSQEDWRIVAHHETAPPAPSSTGPASKPHWTSRGAVVPICCSSTASTGCHARCASLRSSPRSWTG